MSLFNPKNIEDFAALTQGVLTAAQTHYRKGVVTQLTQLRQDRYRRVRFGHDLTPR